MQQQTPNVFALLAKPVRDAAAEQGLVAPTLPQTKAFPHILNGENVLLIAPTGTGKTEAVLLPILSKLVEQKNQTPKPSGIQLLYITPLRALNRDMLRRLMFWGQRLSISVEVRHGDTEQKTRRQQAKKPPQILVTTPETLQAILLGQQMRRHLKTVQWVVVDEVHDLAGSKRGAQLSLGLERLRQVTDGEFQRIGLSATIGNPSQIAAYLAGSRRRIAVVEASTEKCYRYNVEFPTPTNTDYDLAAKLDASPEAAARIRRILELVDAHISTLIFVNSRTVAEVLGHKLAMLDRDDVAVHHGSISKEERIAIEDEFKAGQLRAIICTSTLELGIDVGQVDLVVQYMSPRQVSSLVQRVGRSGHRLGRQSKGIIVAVYPDDMLESLASVKNAKAGLVEPVKLHTAALDVLAHQVAGILMDRGEPVAFDELSKLIARSSLYRRLGKTQLLDLLRFLDSLNQIRLNEDETVLAKTRKTRPYYYENLSMIPDERRYPVINVISDRKIGTLGDEFMALHARIGLSFIMKGKAWRIVQIEEEAGVVHVVPSEDPLASVPGWDGEMLPVPYELAQQTGLNREKIASALKTCGSVEAASEMLSKELGSDKASMQTAIFEVYEHIQSGIPLPTQNHIVLEVYDRYLVVHACFGERVNKALGGVFDAVLSERELISGWWTDGYRILIEAPRKLNKYELAELPKTLFNLTDDAFDAAFNRYLDAKFPFGYKMKFVAERFGALPRGKTMSYQRQAELKSRFDNTPIHRETIREALMEKVDLERAKQVLLNVQVGKVKVSTYLSIKPSPLAYHILMQFGDVTELMAPESALVDNIGKLKMAIDAREVKLLCMKCGEWTVTQKIRDLPEEPRCGNCGSGLLAPLYRNQDLTHLQDALKRRREGKELLPEELKELSQARRKADLVLSYGKQATRALQVKGVGPETASRILGKMHPEDDKFYMDLLKAKIQFLRTREYWDK